jgi:hypothetical protein
VTTSGVRAARERWQDRLTADPWLTAWYAFMAAMLITGAAYIAAGIAQGSTKTAGDGGDWVFFAAFLAGPFWLGRWTKSRQRKIGVERKLGYVEDGLHEVQDGLGRVEQLLTPAEPAQLAVVRDFPPR